MSFLSPADAKAMITHRKELQMRMDSTRQVLKSTKSLSSLMALSKDLRDYSAKNRAVAERLRQDAAAMRDTAMQART